ncbi:MAG TPA: acetyl-CoA carboxylase biotin carboxyl carrier protein subunit [Gemmatimonadaceae bacterium]
MKYLVTVNGEEHEVRLDGAGVQTNGSTAAAHVADIEGTPVCLLTIGDAVHRVLVRRGDRRGLYTLSIGGYRYEVDALDERGRTIRDLSWAAAAAAGPAPLMAPMPGLIVRINVRAGDQVQAGQGLVVMEAMKMENELRAVATGTVKTVLVTPGTAVEKGAVLLEME